LHAISQSPTGYALFCSKLLVVENIYLHGVVATSKNPDGSLEGFAIFLLMVSQLMRLVLVKVSARV